jgi:non-ribosomal peptide synthetase component F
MLRADERDCFMQSSALTFGASLRQTFAPILVGARAAPFPPRQKKDPAAVLDAIARDRVTIFNCVPSLWSFLMDVAEKRGSAAPLAALRWLLIGGEAIPSAYWERWRRLVPAGPRVANLYGGAETIANVTWFEVPPGFATTDLFLPIGWPRYGMRLQLEESGELVVAGAIADGYLNGEPGFLTDPTLGHCYRTGDLAHLTADGALVFVGRRDHRVQIRGHRVELGEIEAVLCQFAGVGAARVDYDAQRLTATLEVRDGPPPDERAVRAFVAERLPGAMVPHEIQFTRGLERNTTGKILRPKVAASGPAPGVSLSTPVPDATPSMPARPSPVPAPSSAVAARWESHLARIWHEVLRLQGLPGPDDDFFLLGGDSVLAIDMVMRVEEVVGRRVSPLLVHTHHRLHQLARAIEQAVGADRGGTDLASVSDAAMDELLQRDHPLGQVQRGFWHAARATGASPLWTARLPIDGPLEWAAFAAAVDWVQDRHPILRTRFSGEPNRPRQRFGAGPRIPVQLDDLSVLPPAMRDSALEQRFAEELAAEIPLGDAPLLRIRLCRLAPDRHVLLATGHHIVTDAHSSWVLLAEIFERCRAYGDGRRPVPELGYADRLMAVEASPDPFWREYLGTQAESDRGLGPADGVDACAKVVLDSAALARLRRAAAARGTSPFGLVYVAAAQTLLEALDTDSVVLATATTGRDADPIRWADAVGPFAFGVPVVVRRGADTSQLASLREALAHAASAPSTLPALLGATGVARLGRYFLSWLETPASSRLVGHPLIPRWSDVDLRFRTESTATAVSIAALAHDGLTLHVRGRAAVHDLAQGIERRLREVMRPRAALIMYAPRGTLLPFSEPTLVETVKAGEAVTEVVLLPIHEGQLADTARLREVLRRAIDGTTAEVVALAGMLPSLTGLGTERLATRDTTVTTGHSVTVVAMLKTVEKVLAAIGRHWADARVGVLGFGAVGQATLQLCVSRMGNPSEVRVADPRFGTSVAALGECDLILGAASTGHVLDVSAIRPGTVVIDDSFPRSFADEDAWRRMEDARDVLLVGGGMLDVGPLERHSPFPSAEEIRARFPTRWLPGCHAEALLLILRPELGPTIGQVELRRATQVLAAVDALSWRAAPLHLGPREIPSDWVAALPRRLRPLLLVPNSQSA